MLSSYIRESKKKEFLERYEEDINLKSLIIMKKKIQKYNNMM